MRVLFYIFMSLLTVFLCSMDLPKKETLLVLTNTINEELFSKFQIIEINGVLSGENVDDYIVTDGIYRIKATSNNKYQNRNIVIKSP